MASIGSDVYMYTGAKTVVRTVYGNSKGFEVPVVIRDCHGGHIQRTLEVALSWELLYADDLAVIAETEEELIKRLNEWKDNVESKGMRVSMKKTKVMNKWRTSDSEAEGCQMAMRGLQ